MSVIINPAAKAAARERSQGLCERCHKGVAVHMHHLSYERAGNELAEDLQHICLYCHMSEHPKKAQEMWLWEMARIARIAVGKNTEEETEEERREIEYREKTSEKEQEREAALKEPAWNLGNYKSSGYDAAQIEQEERDGYFRCVICGGTSNACTCGRAA